MSEMRLNVSSVRERPRLAFCPIGKQLFSHEAALRHKQQIQGVMGNLPFECVDLEDVLQDGMVRDQSQVDAAVQYFRDKAVDALFIPHCNFGTEGAAGLIAHKLGLPTLLWGPRDGAPESDGTRQTDTLCGLFATSKVLHKLAVPFTYLPNVACTEDAWRRGMRAFAGGVQASKVLRRGARIGMIGQRIDFFWSTISNESELLEKFQIEVLPLDMVVFIEAVKKRAKQCNYRDEINQLRAQCHIEDMPDAPLAEVLAVRDVVFELAETHSLDAMTCQSFMSLPQAVGAWTVFADSLIGDHFPFVLESDLCGAISALLLQRASLGQPAFLTDLTTRHPQNDNAVLLWHCGAPLSLKHPDDKLRLGRHWIIPSELSGMTHFRLKDGPITCARFDGDRGCYELAVGEGHSCAGPDTQNNYVWMEVNDWPRWERTLMEGPFMHHIGMVYNHCADALREAVKFVPDVILRDLDKERQS